MTCELINKTNVKLRSVSRQDHFHALSQNHHHYNQHQYRRNCLPELCSYCSDCATCWMMRDSKPGKYKTVLSSSKKMSRPAMGPTQSLVQWVSGSFPGIKRSGYEVCQKPPSTTEATNKWSSISAPSTYLHVVGRDIFAFISAHVYYFLGNLGASSSSMLMLCDLEDLREGDIYIQTNSVALVRTRTIPTERPPPVGEVSANFCG